MRTLKKKIALARARVGFARAAMDKIIEELTAAHLILREREEVLNSLVKEKKELEGKE